MSLVTTICLQTLGKLLPPVQKKVERGKEMHVLEMMLGGWGEGGGVLGYYFNSPLHNCTVQQLAPMFMLSV